VTSEEALFEKSAGRLRITHNPYKNVNWATTGRFLTQTHDHTSDDEIISYHNAGYDVIPYGEHSGNPDKTNDWDELHWPPEDWLLPSTIAAVSSKLLYTGPEQVYLYHITTMFLPIYLEGWYPGLSTTKEDYHYENREEMVDIINAYGGIAIDAHPTLVPPEGVVAQEVYNALFRIQYIDGVRGEDFNETYFLPLWDEALSEGRRLWGVGVNDHYGPWRTPDRLENNSGKTVVLAPTLSEQTVRAAFAEGRLFGVRDLGVTKGQFPTIDAIDVSNKSITVTTVDAVRWISMGAVVATGNSIDVGTLPGSARYVRAEVENADGSVVYVQPFELEQRGSEKPPEEDPIEPGWRRSHRLPNQEP